MSKFYILTALLILAGCDGAANPSTYDLDKPTAAYEVDAWGVNPDIYEFTPKGNDDYFCALAVSGMDDLVAMFCMPRKP